MQARSSSNVRPLICSPSLSRIERIICTASHGLLLVAVVDYLPGWLWNVPFGLSYRSAGSLEVGGRFPFEQPQAEV